MLGGDRRPADGLGALVVLTAEGLLAGLEDTG
jgi:hypothetical protein